MKTEIFKKLLGIPIVVLIFLSALNFSCTPRTEKIDDLFSYAQQKKSDLRFSSYITAHSVQSLLTTEEGRREAVSLFRANGITKAYIEVYRGGLTLDKQVLEEARDFFLKIILTLSEVLQLYREKILAYARKHNWGGLTGRIRKRRTI